MSHAAETRNTGTASFIRSLTVSDLVGLPLPSCHCMLLLGMKKETAFSACSREEEHPCTGRSSGPGSGSPNPALDVEQCQLQQLFLGECLITRTINTAMEKRHQGHHVRLTAVACAAAQRAAPSFAHGCCRCCRRMRMAAFPDTFQQAVTFRASQWPTVA